MPYTILSILALLFSISVSSQNMDAARLHDIIKQEADTLIVSGSSYRFFFNESLLICIHDETANRMRIISPIVEREKIGEEELLNALVANFHSVLDVKYALSDEILWSVYAHPLRELTEAQVVDAIQQVYAAALTFGGSYSSSDLVFPGNTKKKSLPQSKKLLKQF